jgi:hypothetical protein
LDAFAEWAAWAFFNAELADLTSDERTELDGNLKWFQDQVRWHFSENTDGSSGGSSGGNDLRSIRLTLDKV